jgi:hypothetical protein
MTESNFQQALQAFFRLRPFKPFAVELASGDRFTVDDPEAVALRGGVAVYIGTDGSYKLFDSTGVTQLVDQSANGGRGRTRS